MLPTIVTSSPSRIQTVPRPITIIQWKLDQGSRSRREGIRVSIVSPCFGSDPVIWPQGYPGAGAQNRFANRVSPSRRG